MVEHHGRFFDFGPVAFEPKPVQPGGPALQIGGDGAAAFRRVATVGTGWMPMNHSLEGLAASLARIRERASDAGREQPVQVTFSGAVARPEDVEAYRTAGITRLLVRPWTRSSDALEGMARFAEEVIAPLGSA